MKTSAFSTSLVVTALTLCALSPLRAQSPEVKVAPIYPNLTVQRPVALIIAPDGSNRRFLVEQTGKIKILPADENGGEAKVFIDLNDRMRVEKDFEEGLLGLAFHPDFKTNGKFYVCYSKQGPKRSVYSEFTAKGDAADAASERILLQIFQPEWNHNGGNILFGPDGFLYAGVGDGGMKNGVFMLPQKLTHFNGKVLRIDVNAKSPGLEYGIPKDNPCVGVPNACEEIWALGIRNPWGMAFDKGTGLLWLADVGQDVFEEINLIEKGGNYGWEYREGKHEFAGKALLMEALGVKKADPPRGTQFIEPIHEYPHGDGLSITGGYVYRGQAIPALEGRYLYGDWKFGTLWALDYDTAAKAVKSNQVIHKAPNPAEPVVQPTGIYPDEKGEAIVLDWRGKLFRLAP